MVFHGALEGLVAGYAGSSNLMTPSDDEILTDYSAEGVDLTLIRWMLALSPADRLQFAQRFCNRVLQIRQLNAGE